MWWAVKRRWDLLLIKWVRKSVPQTYYGSWGLSRRDFTLRWKFSMYLCSRLLVASNIHMSISCVETPWTWSPHSLPGFRDHRPSSVSFSLPQTNSLTFTVYHRGAYKQDKSLSPGSPLDCVCWMRGKDIFTLHVQLLLLADLPRNVVWDRRISTSVCRGCSDGQATANGVSPCRKLNLFEEFKES